jgi:hypothetical protein
MQVTNPNSVQRNTWITIFAVPRQQSVRADALSIPSFPQFKGFFFLWYGPCPPKKKFFFYLQTGERRVSHKGEPNAGMGDEVGGLPSSSLLAFRKESHEVKEGDVDHVSGVRLSAVQLNIQHME